MTISNFSISPAMFAPGDSVNISFTVKAQNGDEIGEGGLFIWLTIPGYGETSAYVDPTFVISRGQTKTVSAKTAPSLGTYKPTRGSTVSEFGIQLGYFGSRTNVSFPVTLLDARYKPSISLFTAERSVASTPNDEGENLILRTAIAASAAAKTDTMTFRLAYQDKAKPDEDPVSLNLANIKNAALVEATQIVLSQAFAKNSDWVLVLWFGDNYESAAATIEVSRSFANVHFSGASTGGVCFGSFSKATEGKPSFQCYYPSEFYAPAKFESGIHGVTNYEAAEVEVDTGGKWIDGRRIYRQVVPIDKPASTSKQSFYTFESDIEMISLSGYVKRGDGVYRFPPVWWTGGSNYHSIWMDNTKELYYQSSLKLVGHLIIDYVKPN